MNRSHHRLLVSKLLNSLSAIAIVSSAVAFPAHAQEIVPTTPVATTAPAAVQISASPVPETEKTGREKLDDMLTGTHAAVEEKAKSLDMGVVPLPNATPPSGSELENISALQRQIRYLQLMQQRAEAIVGLYDTVNGAKEVSADEDTTSSGTPGNRVLPTPVPPQPVSQPARQTLNATPGYKAANSGAFASGSSNESAGSSGITTETRPAPDLPPVVSSITGTGQDVTAIVLVPYTGEFSVKLGTVLPNGTKITKISASGVEAKDNNGKTTALSFGDSVPMVRPTITVTTTKKTEEPSQPVIMPNNG